MRLTELNKIQGLLKDSQTYREKLYHDTDWDTFEKYWFNIYPQSAETSDLLTVPILVSDAQRQIAALLGGEPRVIVEATSPELVPAARVLSGRLNQLIRDTNLIDELRDAAQDTITCGTGFLLDGFGSQYGVSPQTEVQGFEDSRFGKGGQRIEYNDNIFDNLPWTLRVHPSDILIPPGFVNMAQSFGFFHRYIRSLEEVRQDEKLIQKHRGKIKSDGIIDYAWVNNPRQEQHGDYQIDQQRVILYDWYDLRTNSRTTFSPSYPYALAHEVDEILIRINRLPLHGLVFNKNSRHFWGTSDFDFGETNAKEVNDIRTMMMRQRRLEILKGIIDFDKLVGPNGEDIQNPKDFVDKLTSDQIMALLFCHGDPRNVWAQIQPSQQWDFASQLDICKRELQEFGLAIGPNQKGLMASGRHTAYEAQMTETNYDRSLAPRRMPIRKALLDIVYNWSQMIFDFWVEPQMVPTYDAAGNLVVVAFKGADLRGDYRFNVSLDSLRAKSHDDRINEANMILSQMMPFVQMGVMNPMALARQYLSRLDSDWDIDTLLGGPGQMGAPVPFSQYQQQFQQQMPQNGPSIASFMQNQGPPQQMNRPQGPGQPSGAGSPPGGQPQ